MDACTQFGWPNAVVLVAVIAAFCFVMWLFWKD